ncbi:MAG: winged helix DNA-binding domain-containing protein, partial [Propionibacteriales bacterium]|nr:winged helix DNA-binding domain-containing protein [Propionibacteriales bacterium]
HSTDPASVYLSAWARIHRLSRADVDEALYDDRTVVKHLAMRRTVWAVPPELLPVVQAAASDDVAATQRRQLSRDVVSSGITQDGDRWVAEAEAAAVAVLAEHGPTSGRDLTRLVPQLQAKLIYGTGEKQVTVGVVTRVVTVLSASGQVTRGRARGAWTTRTPTWVLMHDWCPVVASTPPIEAAMARARLAGHWLRTFGPATQEDLKWWAGWTVAQTRTALRDVKAVEVALDGDRIGLVLPDDVEPGQPVRPWVALLPALDPTTMGWKTRDWYLRGHGARLFDRNGNAGPTLWSNGHVIGGWGQRPDGEVVVGLLEEADTETRSAVDDEAARLTQWLDGVRVLPSFPTPLQRELSR